MTQRAAGDRIFILYPAGVRSGGAEALHQLCDALVSEGVEASMVPLRDTAGADNVPDYGRYRCVFATEVPDEDGVVVVLPEIAISAAWGFDRARVVVWWLSIDFAEPYRHRLAVARGERSVLGRVAHLLQVAAPWRAERSSRALRGLLPTLSHCAQSTYAVVHLRAHEGLVANDLSDYLHAADWPAGDTAGGDRRAPRSVAYNPAKGGAFYDALRDLAPDLAWRPVQGLDRVEVGDLLRDTEVYLDLGHHPGKDRIPREAALAGCVVVAARRGSAAFPQDMPIQDELRVDTTRSVRETARRAWRLLDEVLADPEPWRRGQEDYRRQIRDQEEVFRREVRRVFLGGELVAPARGRGYSRPSENAASRSWRE